MTKMKIEDLKGSKAERFFTVDRASVNTDERTIELAFSSEAPVERYWGVEILDHKPGSMRMDRLKNAAPLLLQHDPDRQIGVVDQVRIDGDKTGRAVVRFSRSTLGEEILRDVQDGIRQSVSVGYAIHDLQLEGSSNGVDTYRITDWEPLEVSLVSIPADINVGIGRSFSTLEREVPDMGESIEAPVMEPEKIEAPAEEGRAQTVTIDPARAAIDKRIREIGKHFGMEREAEDHIMLGSTIGEFQSAVQAANSARLKPVPSAPRVEVAIPRRVGRLKAFENNSRGEEAAYRSGMWAQAVLFGNTDAQRWCKDYGVRVMTSTTPTTSVLVPDEMMLPIIDLREQYGVARQRCFVVPMASETATVPRRKSGVTAYFVGQTQATTESDAAFDDIQLVAREVAALTRISTSYAADSAINLADHLANEMAYAFAIKEDECLIKGDGTSTYGGIQGIRSKVLGTAGAVDAASGHDTFAELTAADLISVIGVLPQFPGIRPAWYCSKRANAMVFQTLKYAEAGNVADVQAAMQNSFLGDEIVISQAMPAVTTDLSDVAMLIYGDLNMGVTFGDRAGFEIQVLRERYAEYRQIGIQAVERFDINVHGCGDATNAGPICALIGE